MSTRARRTWIVGVALTLAGCLSPTLPLPPPANPTVVDQGNGTVELSGSVEAQSQVLALNNSSNEIIGQNTETGAYRFTIAAKPGDDITFWYQNGADVSPSIDFLIK
jgi:hypothetical protein